MPTERKKDQYSNGVIFSQIALKFQCNSNQHLKNFFMELDKKILKCISKYIELRKNGCPFGKR